jgi:uncharacterized linocin/CFP29 family protein
MVSLNSYRQSEKEKHMATTATAPATAPATPPATGAPITTPAPPTATSNGRDKVHWSKEIWDNIDLHVTKESERTRVARRFLPRRPVVPRTTSVPTDSITPPTKSAPNLTVDEGATTRINEFWVEFALTPQQVDHEMRDINETGHSTAVTLATRAANLLAQAEDLVIFQGQNALTGSSLFQNGIVFNRGVPADAGLLDIVTGAAALPASQIIQVPPKSPDVYGENTFAAVAKGYSVLQGNGQYGPYALVLHFIPYADTYAPLPTTLILTADRIEPLMTAGFFGTGTLPPAGTKAPFFGVLVSLGGNSMDLVVGLDATTAFMQQDTDGNYRFRVVERFGLRLKDISAVVRLEFQ